MPLFFNFPEDARWNAERQAVEFGVEPTPNFAPTWNAAPTDAVPVVRHDAKARERSLDLLRWGLVPYWAKDIKVGFANINAKAEGIEGKPAFRGRGEGDCGPPGGQFADCRCVR